MNPCSKGMYKWQISPLNDIQLHQPSRKWKLKPRLSYHLHLSGWLKLKTVTTPNAGKNAEKLVHSYNAGRNVKWSTATLENSLAVAFKSKCVFTI